MHPNIPDSPEHELARAIALANMPLPAPNDLPLLGEQDPNSAPVSHICAYRPFVAELARALRLPGQRPPTPGPVDEDLWWSVFRPAYGFATLAALKDTQSELARVLRAILEGEASPLMEAATGLKLSLAIDTFTLSKPAKTSRGRGRRSRGLMQKIQVGVFYIPAAGRDSFVYGIASGGEANYFNRLARCVACQRFILGKTDRPVRYCAEPGCRAVGTEPHAEAPTRDAAYQRQHRARTRRWHEFERGELASAIAAIRDADRSPSAKGATRKLQAALADADALIVECFPRQRGPRWEVAMQRVAEARDLLSKGFPQTPRRRT